MNLIMLKLFVLVRDDSLCKEFQVIGLVCKQYSLIILLLLWHIKINL